MLYDTCWCCTYYDEENDECINGNINLDDEYCSELNPEM